MPFLELTIRGHLTDINDRSCLDLVKGCVFQEIICNKVADQFRIRLLFEQDSLTRYSINTLYDRIPDTEPFVRMFQMIGKRVASVKTEPSDGRQITTIVFEDGSWQRL